ncbi:hypothetical protein N9N24_05005 [Candidatus Marinimicrobia bacterium]|jgi:hypothetical protein|nr:hypothetical protein [Candidatus Neomarinimicrobiota bacterium]
MKEYRSWSDYWRNLKSRYNPNIIRDSYFYSDLKDEDDQYFIHKIISTDKSVKSTTIEKVPNDRHSDKP